MIFLLGELKLFCLKIILPIFLLLRSRIRHYTALQTVWPR